MGIVLEGGEGNCGIRAVMAEDSHWHKVKSKPKIDQVPSACQLVAVDVDGTLLTSSGVVACSSIRTVVEARERGVTVALASSRGPAGLLPVLRSLDMRSSWFIAYQGALVARWTEAGLETLFERRVDPTVAGVIERAALASGISIGRYVDSRWHVPSLDALIMRESSITGEEPILVSLEEMSELESPHKLLAMIDASSADRLRTLSQSLPADAQAVFSHDNYLEITARGVDKATGLVALAEYLSIRLATGGAAIGDGVNDLGMFAVAGTSFAMGNAPASVKSAATFVTADNDHDGVASALTALLARE